jgi:hypothetical protein
MRAWRRGRGEVRRHLQPDTDHLTDPRPERDRDLKDDQIRPHAGFEPQSLKLLEECAGADLGDHDTGVGPTEAVTKVMPLRRWISSPPLSLYEVWCRPSTKTR